MKTVAARAAEIFIETLAVAIANAIVEKRKREREEAKKLAATSSQTKNEENIDNV